MRENISVSLPSAVKAQLAQFVAQGGTSRSQVIREALQEYLWRHELRMLRAQALPRAHAQGVYTDEDVFKVVS